MKMNILLYLINIALLFSAGSVTGWCIEVVFRRFEPDNKERLWINPGFLCGPCLPIYGFGLILLYHISLCERYIGIDNKIIRTTIILAAIAAAMTLIEFAAGEIFIIRRHIKLWDYSNNRFNYKGIICLRYSLCWALIGAFYYYFLHPGVLAVLLWFSHNPLFSFVIGLFYGVLFVDISYTFKLSAKIKAFAEENEMVIRYEELKRHIRIRAKQTKEKYNFLRALGAEQSFKERLKEYMQKQIEQADIDKLHEFYKRTIKKSKNKGLKQYENEKKKAP